MDDNIVSTPKFVAFVIAFAMLAALLVLDNDGFIPIIYYANVAFHEAGHFIFRVFGEPMGLYGGTLGTKTLSQFFIDSAGPDGIFLLDLASASSVTLDFKIDFPVSKYIFF